MAEINLRLSKSSVGVRETEAVRRIIRENGVSGAGAEVEAFEREIKAYLETGHEVVLTDSGASAIELALRAGGIGPGDEVIAPSLASFSTYKAIRATGAAVVPAEVREADGWLDLTDVERRIAPLTRAIVPVHYAGGAGDLEALYCLARRYELRVVEDAGQAFGSRYGDSRVGGAGDIACFSFDHAEDVIAAKAGAVVTGDTELAAAVRRSRHLGVNLPRPGSDEQHFSFEAADHGWLYYQTDVVAAIGRIQLNRLTTEFAPRRVDVARRYDSAFARLGGVCPLKLDYVNVVPSRYAVRIADGRRDLVRDALARAGIETGVPSRPLHLLPKYAGVCRLPVAERMHRELLFLPLHSSMSCADADRVCEVVRSVVSNRVPAGALA